ncbi:MAG: preprotein translocase subunit SecE [Capsulimonas sp.]|uniref:preprotein translocase subunit SecE n=1 Tax=Capsulimonas sp. TaxID=2494211 RepID=UPI003262F399
MADTPNKNQPAPTGPKKPVAPTNPAMAAAQKRAAAMATRKPVSPQQFFQEAWIELQKTSWPTREVLLKSTTVVLALVFAVAIWTGALNVILDKLMTPLFTGK